MFKPVLENGKVDLIVEKNNKYFRLQIKTIQKDRNSKRIPIRKISHNMGLYKISRYTNVEIDYFIGVDIENEDLYILPVSFSSKYKSSIGLNVCQFFKNNFKQMERCNGNITNEHDDNVESLTDNADGNDVGMESYPAANE